MSQTPSHFANWILREWYPNYGWLKAHHWHCVMRIEWSETTRWKWESREISMRRSIIFKMKSFLPFCFVYSNSMPIWHCAICCSVANERNTFPFFSSFILSRECTGCAGALIYVPFHPYCDTFCRLFANHFPYKPRAFFFFEAILCRFADSPFFYVCIKRHR